MTDDAIDWETLFPVNKPAKVYLHEENAAADAEMCRVTNAHNAAEMHYRKVLLGKLDRISAQLADREIAKEAARDVIQAFLDAPLSEGGGL